MTENVTRYYGPTVPHDIDAKQLRAWAIERGLLTGQRGRIAQSVIDAYLREHPEA